MKEQPRASFKRTIATWFELSPAEHKWIRAILAIFLLGLIARYFHLKNQEPERLNTIRPEEVDKILD